MGCGVLAVGEAMKTGRGKRERTAVKNLEVKNQEPSAGDALSERAGGVGGCSQGGGGRGYWHEFNGGVVWWWRTRAWPAMWHQKIHFLT